VEDMRRPKTTSLSLKLLQTAIRRQQQRQWGRHTLAHVSHAQMGEGLVDVLLALVESGDDGEHSGKVLVTLSLV